MKILVPVDGSFASLNAAKKAVDIARKYDFSIKLVSVLDNSDLSRHARNDKLWRQVDGSIITGDDVSAKKVKESATKLLDEIFSEVDFSGVETESEVLMGDPYLKIVGIAKDEKFDLIVMGNRGFSKIKRFFVGSVAQKVISEAPCPVLVIHTEAEA
jgi:nucleotide-binding universal stress UspA family protein